MLRLLLAATVFSSLVLSACGGSDSGTDTKGGGTAGGARAMAAAMETDLARLKECFQGEKDGKAPCGVDLLTAPVTGFCSDVHTGKSNTFGVSDYKPFEPICASWVTLLSTPLAERPTVLAAMIEKAKAIN